MVKIIKIFKKDKRYLTKLLINKDYYEERKLVTMNIYTQKFKEALFSIFPITAIVMVLNFTLTPLEIPLIIRFIIGAFLIIVGLSIFFARSRHCNNSIREPGWCHFCKIK